MTEEDSQPIHKKLKTILEEYHELSMQLFGTFVKDKNKLSETNDNNNEICLKNQRQSELGIEIEEKNQPKKEPNKEILDFSTSSSTATTIGTSESSTKPTTATSTISNQKSSDLMDSLISKDEELLSCICQLENMFTTLDRNYRIKMKCLKRADYVSICSKKLKEIHNQLLMVVEEHRPDIERLEITEQHPVDASSVISYANKISFTSSAPPGWDSSMPLVLYCPPAPQEEQMRSGLLYQPLPPQGNKNTKKDGFF